jgi:hypothetical protein
MAENRVLLVEGIDDLHVLGHIFLNQNIEVVTEKRVWKVDEEKRGGRIIIKEQEGVDKLKKRLNENAFDNLLEDLSVELKGSELTALGIIVDADLEVKARWQSLANKLKDLNYEDVPDLPKSSGTICTGKDLPKIGVWLMPDNTLPGMLEDFVKLLVPDEQKSLLEKAVNAVELIPKKERLFITENSDKTSKAQIHTYLAWQSRPGVPYGVAIREKFLKADSQHANNLMKWIKELFNL